MSKDILGSLVRVLVTVPEDRLGLVQDVAHKLSATDGGEWVGPLKNFLRKESCWVPRQGGISATLDQLSSWIELYRDLGITLDPTEVKILDHIPGLDRLIVVAKGMTPNRAYDECQKRFKCWKYTEDLDRAVPTNDRTPENGTYAIWIRDRVEADEELKSKSADDLKETNTKGVTLLERMLHELKYFTETGKHLDLKNWTLCSGSRDSDDLVPRASWRVDEFSVGWLFSSNRHSNLRSRAVVAL